MRVAVIVPCCNDLQGELQENLLAIARQRRRPDRLILVARGGGDTALPVMKALRRAYPFVRVVLAGAAETCSQKNHSLIAALAHTGHAELYVFADSDIRPDEEWLDDLLEPLETDPRIGASSALGALPAGDGRLVSAMQALFAMHQCGFQRLASYAWGGSMAVRASVFHAADVVPTWSRTVIDDLVLSRQVGRLARVVTLPAVHTGAAAKPGDWGACLLWSVRQYQYVKVHLSFAFRALVAWELLACAVVVVLPVGVLLGVPAAAAILPGLAYVGGMTVVNLVLFGIGRGRSGLLARVGASILFGFLVIYVTLAAWLQRKLIWRGIAYQMDDDGNVVSVQLRIPQLQGEAATCGGFVSERLRRR